MKKNGSLQSCRQLHVLPSRILPSSPLLEFYGALSVPHPPTVQRFIRTSIHPSSRSPRAPNLPQLSASAPFVLPSIHMSIRPLVSSPARPPCSTSVSPARRAAIHTYIHPSIHPSSRSPRAPRLAQLRSCLNPHVHPSSRSIACPSAMLHFCITPYIHPPAVQRFIRTSIHPSSRSPRAPHLPQLRSCFRQSTCPSVLSFARLPVRHAPLLYHPPAIVQRFIRTSIHQSSSSRRSGTTHMPSRKKAQACGAWRPSSSCKSSLRRLL